MESRQGHVSLAILAGTGFRVCASKIGVTELEFSYISSLVMNFQIVDYLISGIQNQKQDSMTSL